MTDRFRLTMGQLNATVGDLAGNAAKARAAFAAARAAGADMLALPEMFITGYQTQDLVLKPAFLRDAMAAVERLAADCADILVVDTHGQFAAARGEDAFGEPLEEFFGFGVAATLG